MKTNELEKGVRQLFLDDGMVERIEYLKRVVNQPTKFSDNPIIRNDKPWQTYRAQVYGTALDAPDTNPFKLWYLAGARLPFEEPVTINGCVCCPNFQSVGYATSQDGFHFELPNLSLVNFNGSTANNLCRIGRECVEGISVLYEPNAEEEHRRYKAFYWEHFVPYENVPGTPVNGMSVSFSADGTNWMNYEGNPVIGLGSDTGQQVVWDSKLEKYVVYGRFGAGGRKAARSESHNFVHWSNPKLVFQADENDGPGTQIYGMGVSIYEGIYLGMPWIFREGSTWKIDVQLATSRDGIHWQRVSNQQTFIPNGPEGNWDAGIIFTASQPVVVVGNTIYIYYSACRHNHDYRLPIDQRTEQWWNSIKTSIGVATLRRDGFVSLDAGEREGNVLTKPFILPRGQLYLNANAQGGLIRVAIYDEAGKPLDDFESSQPIVGDALNALVKWRNRDLREIVGRKVRVRLSARHAKIYSYWFE